MWFALLFVILIYMGISYYYSPPTKELKFIHITKCGGSFLEDTAKSNDIKWGRFHKEYGNRHHIFIDKPTKLKIKYDWFRAVVRNPYDRILSEYYCEWGGIGLKKITHNKELFNNYLIKKINDRSLIGDHYTEQYKYIDPNIPIHIIKLENFEKELKCLFKHYNILSNVDYTQKTNSAKHKNKGIMFTIHDFDYELIQLINEVYANDFLLFNYEMM